MALRIEQEAELLKSSQSRDGTSPLGRWSWRVWIEGEEGELGQVDWVRYQLHPTFPEPTQIIADRNTKFELRGSCWGEFTIYAAAHHADGSEQNFKHWLRLAGPPGVPAPPMAYTLGGEAPKLFLTYAFADTHMAQAVGEALRASQVQVIDPYTKLCVGDQWRDSIGSALDAADVAAVFISEGVPPSLLDEVRRIREKGIDLLPIVILDRKSPEVPEDLLPYGPLQVKAGEDPIEIANRILQQMPALRASSPTAE